MNSTLAQLQRERLRLFLRVGEQLETSQAMARLPGLAIVLATALQNGNQVLTLGNGGSAAAASHLATELLGRIAQERAPLPAICLADSSSAITAIANDYGFDCVFERQVLALAKSGDVLIVFSTSGSSPNVLHAANAARSIGVHVAAFTASDASQIGRVADTTICIPTNERTVIQEYSLHLCHSLVIMVEEWMSSLCGNRSNYMDSGA